MIYDFVCSLTAFAKVSFLEGRLSTMSPPKFDISLRFPNFLILYTLIPLPTWVRNYIRLYQVLDNKFCFPCLRLALYWNMLKFQNILSIYLFYWYILYLYFTCIITNLQFAKINIRLALRCKPSKG